MLIFSTIFLRNLRFLNQIYDSLLTFSYNNCP
jgi:hypothetical protein